MEVGQVDFQKWSDGSHRGKVFRGPSVLPAPPQGLQGGKWETDPSTKANPLDLTAKDRESPSRISNKSGQEPGEKNGKRGGLAVVAGEGCGGIL